MAVRLTAAARNRRQQEINRLRVRDRQATLTPGRAGGAGSGRAIADRQSDRAEGLNASQRTLQAVRNAGSSENSRDRLIARRDLVTALEERLAKLPESETRLRLRTGFGGGATPISGLVANRERSADFKADQDALLRSGEAGQLVMQAAAIRRAVAEEVEGENKASGFGANTALLRRLDTLLGRFNAVGFASAGQGGTSRSPTGLYELGDRRQLDVEAGVNRRATEARNNIAARRNRQVSPADSTLRRRANTLLVPTRGGGRTVLA